MKLDRQSLRPFVTFAAGLFILVACQNATEPSGSSNGPVDVTGKFKGTSSTRIPDSTVWKAPNDSGSQKPSCNGSDCNETFHLSKPLGSDSLKLELWTLGIRTTTLYFGEIGSSPNLDLKETFLRDTLDTLLLSKYYVLTTAQKASFSALGTGPSSLVSYYASLIVSGDTAFKGKSFPVGMTQAAVNVDLVYWGFKSNWTVKSLTGLNLDTGFIRTAVSTLIKQGALYSSDSSALFPPYPIRVSSPISVNGSLTVGGNAVSVTGTFAWTKGKFFSPTFEVHTSKGVDPNFNFIIATLPSRTDVIWILDSNLTIQAKPLASVGTDTLVVTLSNDSGYFATSRTIFQVVAKDVTPPVLKITSPSKDTIVPNGTGSILVMATASDSGSGLDSVKIGLSKHTTLPYSDSVALAVGANPIIVQAWDKAGNSTTVTVVVTRAQAVGDTVPPTLKITSPSKDTNVSYSVTSIAVTATATDSGSGIDFILIGSAKLTAAPYTTNVNLAFGTDSISVQAWDKAGNRTSSFIRVTRGNAPDTTPPVVKRLSVGQDTTVAWSTKSITLSWTVTDDSLFKVTLNDSVLVGVSGSNLYQKTVNLSVGIDTFTILALDKHGNPTKDIVHITRLADVSRPLIAVTSLTDTVRLVEDSLTTVSFKVQNFVGSSLTVRFTPKDSTLISRRTWTLVPDGVGMVAISLQGKLIAFGGPITCSIQFADSLDTANLTLPLTIAARNHPPTFGGMANLVVSSDASHHTYPGWIDSIFAGAANESYQKVSFQLLVLTGSALFSSLPVVDSTGTLSFTGKVISSGPSQIQVRAVDNDSVDPGNRYSPWRTASIFFNTSPTLTLSARTASTYPGVPISSVTATVFDLETSANNLAVSWTVSDSTVLPHDNVLVQQTGGSRSILLRPVSAGTAKAVFTITDSLGASGKDSLTLTVYPINHAPILQLTKVAYSFQNYNRDSLVSNFVSVLSAADSLQYIVSRRVDVLGIPLDSAFTAAPILDAQGTLHLPRKPNLTGTVTLRITVKDNGGTASGGVDTAFTDVKLSFSDTIIDPADGQAYRYRVLGNRSWFAQNLRRQPKWGTVNSDSNGVLYHWAQGFDQDSANCDDSACAMTMITYAAQGLCPSGWNIPMDQEWKNLVNWADNGQPDSVGSSRLRSQTSWTWAGALGSITNASGTDNWGFGVKTNYGGGDGSGNVWRDARFWANTLSPDSTGGTLGRVFADFTPTGFSVWGLYAARYDLWFPIRCVKTLPPGQW